MLIFFLTACSGGVTSPIDTGNVECGHGTHLLDGECVANDDTAADDTNSDSTDTNVDTDTGAQVTTYWYLDNDEDGWAGSGTKLPYDPGSEFYIAVTDASTYTFDCNDYDAAINPGAMEILDDGVDENCDGYDSQATWYADVDGDGAGDSENWIMGTAADIALYPGNWVDNASDCDDTDPSVTSGWIFYADVDLDGYGDIYATTDEKACTAPDGYVDDASDCDDTSAAINPAASEICDGFDDDCDGSVPSDEQDSDGDGLSTCAGDCVDTNNFINPSASEICDGLDNDCNGTVDVGATDATNWFYDADLDGYGNVTAIVSQCDQPAGYVSNNTDCNDASSGVNPSASEVCDGVDNDCDELVDDADASVNGQSVWFQDADGDEYGNVGSPKLSCSQPSGYVSDDNDCDDAVATTYPGAPTVCAAGVDANCDGSDDSVDGDGDGVLSCDGDCNDANATIYPGASEYCNDVDDDCDGSVDESAADASTWYQDADSDSFGNEAVNVSQCDQPAGYVSDATDCDDASNGINPGASEVCNDIDDDCDGLTDDADPSITGQTTWYYDGDGDTYGNASDNVTTCDQPAADSHGKFYVPDGTDIDDADKNVH